MNNKHIFIFSSGKYTVISDDLNYILYKNKKLTKPSFFQDITNVLEDIAEDMEKDSLQGVNLKDICKMIEKTRKKWRELVLKDVIASGIPRRSHLIKETGGV